MEMRRFLAVTVGAMVLGGLLLTNYGPGVTPAAAAVTQNWDKVLPAKQRFVVLQDFAKAAVRDNETGLVWEQSPATTTGSWTNARFNCSNKNVGGRKAWRLPSFPELASLIDPSVAAGPTLPPGHPFTNVQSAGYWAATAIIELPSDAWGVNFSNGNVTRTNKSFTSHAWCVRGAIQESAY